jgi:hypothetical protein
MDRSGPLTATGLSMVSEILTADGQPELAEEVRRFAAQLRPPQIENELLLNELPRRTGARREVIGRQRR